MQIQLARWQRNWQSLWADAVQRIQMADQAQVWSERVLEISGILSRGVASGSLLVPFVTCFNLLPSVCTAAMPFNTSLGLPTMARCYVSDPENKNQGLTSSEFSALKQLCRLSKNLYNIGLTQFGNTTLLSGNFCSPNKLPLLQS